MPNTLRPNETITDASALMRRADAGDVAALSQLRQALDRTPELWTYVGDLAKQAEIAWITVASGSNPVISEALSRRTTDLRRELSGPAPTVLERLLVDRVLTSWLHVHHADRMCARTGLTAQQRAYVERSLDRAQRRYLSAIRSLATVRRLLLPVLQVNVPEIDKHVFGA